MVTLTGEKSFMLKKAWNYNKSTRSESDRYIIIFSIFIYLAALYDLKLLLGLQASEHQLLRPQEDVLHLVRAHGLHVLA